MTPSRTPISPASALAAARASASPLNDFPGALPGTLIEAYAMQDAVMAALGLVPRAWKVGLIAPELQHALGQERLVGPAAELITATVGAPTEIGVIGNGFAAIEAEIALEIGTDLPIQGRPYRADELAAAVGRANWAVEVAGSSLATILQLGPLAVIADLGNNAAIILGPTIPGWSARELSSLTATTAIDNVWRGSGSADAVPGGPLAALAFLVANLAARGRWLRRGDWVSTGAICGVHPIVPGSTATVDFIHSEPLTLRIVAGGA